MAAPVLPPPLIPVVDACRHAGGRALLVGGCVRDAWMGQRQKAVDIEVHHISLESLRAVLGKFGRISEVGRSFGVLKLRIGREEFDFSLPRRDSKVGAGHKGIAVVADPELGIVEAARRRDLTINAIGYDPVSASFEDPFDGRGDISRQVLRAVDVTTFGEDPLRAVRVVQFVARFGFEVDPSLESLCANMPLGELPPERVVGELEKLFLLGRFITKAWHFAHRTGIWAKVVPSWHRDCPADLDRLAGANIESEARRFSLLLAASLQPNEVESVMDSLRLHRWRGYALRAQVHALVAAKTQLSADPTDTEVVRAAETADMALLAELLDAPLLSLQADKLGVLSGPLPALLFGRDLAALGLPPGPAMGALLAELREAQLLGQVSSVEDARRWAVERLR